MKYVDVQLGPYLPDLGGAPYPQSPGYLVDAVNVRSTAHGYRGVPYFADVSSATTIGSTAFSGSGLAASFYNDTITSHFLVTSAGVVWESRAEGSDTWQDVSPTGTALDAFGDLIFSDGDVIIVSGTRAPVKKTLTATHATAFSALAGSPPTASVGARVRSHVVLGNLSTDVFGIQTSAIGDHEDWPTPGSADALEKQSIYESLNPEYGRVRRILGGDKFGIVVQEHALTRMTYVGGNTVYEFDTYERFQGNGVRRARFVTDGERWYWYNDYGLWATDGYNVAPVSEGKIDDAIFNNILGHTNGGIANSLSAAYDPRRKVAIFAPDSASYHLMYGSRDGNFTFLNHSNLYAVFNGNASGIRDVYAISTNNRRLQKFNGAGVTVAMQTGFVEIEPGFFCRIRGMHLLGGQAPSLTLAYKTASAYTGDMMSQSGFTSFTAPGRGIIASARDNAPLIAFRITGSMTGTNLVRGVRVYYEKGEPVQ